MQSTNPKKKKNRIPVPQRDLSIIITIPACREPEIHHTLNALLDCTRPQGAVEVLVLLNSSENAEPEVTETNRQTELDILAFSRMYSDEKFCIHCIYRTGIPEKLAGAGYARKIAMDLAMSRFNYINKPEGIILSLDADTICEPNYLVEIERHFMENPRSDACSIYFEHPIEGNAFPECIYHGIIHYELHLRYYIQALRYAGHPHAYHTLGSCFAVRAGVYERQGGMNKRKAGEDFYFLHKIIPLGNFHEINTTCLKPSPRPSSRVPFGTGPVIEKFDSGEITTLETYNPAVFEDLKRFLAILPSMFRVIRPELEKIFLSCPPSIRGHLGPEFYERIDEINRNSGGEAAFRKRFFQWFGIFRVLKFINHAHRYTYAKQGVEISIRDFLLRTDPAFVSGRNPLELLLYLRQVQKNAWK